MLFCELTHIFLKNKFLRNIHNNNECDIRKMLNNHRENISGIMNVNSVIQYKHDISKTLTRIKEYFLKMLTNIFHINV